MTGAGDLDRRVTILDYSWDQTDEFGNPIISYTPVGTVWAKRTDLSDSERVAAYGIVATLVSRFLVRSSELTRSINPADRLDHDGKEWNITGVKEAKFGRLEFLEITAMAEL